ncbi:MAG: hypothetical protein Q8P83_03360 [bacterium]|nr:hypothetical protein [bacterium]
MQIFIALGLITFITIAVSLLNKSWSFRVCPICAGVSLTWISFLVVGLLGYQINWFIPAILMGGSVVGIAYWLERYVSANQSNLLAKTVFMLVGFFAVYEIVLSDWLKAGSTATLLLIIIFYYRWLFKKRLDNKNTKTIQALEKKMDDCC